MQDITLRLQRMNHTATSTAGILTENGKHLGFVIEDGPQDEKIPGITRIWCGTYEIKKRIAETPMTLKYRNRTDLPEFDYHLELQAVNQFDYIYIHIGNHHRNSMGCLLVNTGVSHDGEDFTGSRSGPCFARLYKRISNYLNKGNRVFIEVLDEE